MKKQKRSNRETREKSYVRQRSRISDVLRSVAEQNMGGGFCIKAVTRYTLLADVFLFFFPTAVGIVLKNFKISFSVLDFGQRG